MYSVIFSLTWKNWGEKLKYYNELEPKFNILVFQS